MNDVDHDKIHNNVTKDGSQIRSRSNDGFRNRWQIGFGGGL